LLVCHERRHLELLQRHERERSRPHDPVTVAAFGQPGNPLTVTLTNDASMTAASPAACENTYFSMPSLAGIAASGGAAVATASPATDAWTN